MQATEIQEAPKARVPHDRDAVDCKCAGCEGPRQARLTSGVVRKKDRPRARRGSAAV